MSPTWPVETLTKISVIINPKDPNKAWIDPKEPEKYQKEIKDFLNFLKHASTTTGPTTFLLSKGLNQKDANDLKDFFDIYRDSIGLPHWLQIEIE